MFRTSRLNGERHLMKEVENLVKDLADASKALVHMLRFTQELNALAQLTPGCLAEHLLLVNENVKDRDLCIYKKSVKTL